MTSSFIAMSSVWVGIGSSGTTPMLARIALIEGNTGTILLSTYVRPTAPVTDLRVQRTGIQPAQLSNLRESKPFSEVQQLVSQLIRHKIIIGHKIWMTLSVLGIAHPALHTRDLALYIPFRNTLRGVNHIFELDDLVQHFMLRKLGQVEDPIEYARGSLDLYRTVSAVWESALASHTWPCALPPDAYSRCYV